MYEKLNQRLFIVWIIGLIAFYITQQIWVLYLLFPYLFFMWLLRQVREVYGKNYMEVLVGWVKRRKEERFKR